MSENKEDDGVQALGDGGKKQDFTPPATQDELNKIISQRIAREREKYADYEALKAKAVEFDKLSESQKSVEQKHAERIAALEKALADSEFNALKSSIQARYSISDDDAELFLTATDPDKLEAQAKALAARVDDRKRNSPVVDFQTGDAGETNLNPLREFTRQVFKN